MAGKITTILAKKEADTYCTQGLHKEALHLYRNLLATSPNIDPSFKDGIEKQIEKISAAMDSDDLEEANRLSAADIQRVKQGWGEQATEGDMLICAQAFYQIGHYNEALIEMAQMLRNGCSTERISHLFADCLVKLHNPEQVAKTIQSICAPILKSAKVYLDFRISLIEEMVALQMPRHANALLKDLQNEDGGGKTDGAIDFTEITGRIHHMIDLQAEAKQMQNVPVTDLPGDVHGSGRDNSPAEPALPKKEKARSFFRWPFSFKKRS